MHEPNLSQTPDLEKSFSRLKPFLGSDEGISKKQAIMSVTQEYIQLEREQGEDGDIPEYILYMFGMDEFPENITLYKEAARNLLVALANLDLGSQVQKVMNNDALYNQLPLMLLRFANMCEDLDRGHLRAELDLHRIQYWGHHYEHEYDDLLSKYTIARDRARITSRPQTIHHTPES